MAMIKKKTNADMFSFLPDHVISLILSFLPFIDAARTSVLSKRWRHIWHATVRIEFDESFFVKREESTEKRELARCGFIDFMRQWMLNYKEPVVETFSLSFTNPGEYRLDMENCLRFAILRGTRGLFDVSEFSAFSVLKDLSLGWVEVRSSSLKALLMNCPLLEGLCLKNCWNLGDPDISGPNLRLRRLIIDKCSIDNHIILMAQKLQYFKYSGLVKSFLLEDQPDVEEAELDFGLESEFDNSGYCGDTLQDILRNIYSNTLTVCSYMLQELPSGEEPLRLYPYLDDMRHLILKTSMHSYELYGISFLLKSCPGLDMLTIDLGPARIFADYEPPFQIQSHVFWAQHIPFIDCVRETLKVVEVNGFKGEPNEIELLQNVLRYGCVLERMRINVIKSSDSDPTYQWRAQMLQYFTKASRRLQVVIS
ncbi:F-box protein [Vitis vinifera]|uniref:F-box protein n=1 Tax=Vitis vinifera TaxID=29760 RepID=A0A438ISI0_VITVI|nr:F-box protein [Vitis vinifera]